MRRFAMLLALVVTAGCATAIRPASVAPPPSEKLRAEWGMVAVIGRTNLPSMVWQSTPGKGGGAAAGAFNGAAYTTAMLAGAGNGYGALLGLAISPATALIGAGVGAIKAEPAALVQQHHDALQRAVAAVNWPEAMCRRVADHARVQTNLALRVGEVGDAPTVLEVGVTELGLLSPVAANPDLLFVMALEARLYRASDRAVLYEKRLLYSGATARLAEWARDQGHLWRHNMELGLGHLSRLLTEQVFLLYLMKESVQ